MLYDDMLKYENPANLNAVMFSRHFLGCNAVFVKIRSALLFEVSPMLLTKHFHLTDRPLLGELYRQFVSINPFMLQVIQVLLSNHIQVIPYEYESEYLNREDWNNLLIEFGYPKLNPALVFPKNCEDRDRTFLEYAKERETVGFITTKPLSLAKSYFYPSRVYPTLNNRPYSYRATISNKHFQALYNIFVNNTLLHGAFLKTKAYAHGFAKIGPLSYILCQMIHKRLRAEAFDLVHFMPGNYLLYFCYQRLYPYMPATMSEAVANGDKVLLVDLSKEQSYKKESAHHKPPVSTSGNEYFNWKVPKKYLATFLEITQLLSNTPFALTDIRYYSTREPSYPKSLQENKVLCDIYNGAADFVIKFHQFLPEYVEDNLGPLNYKDGFRIYKQEIRKKHLSLYGWLKKNKLVRLVYSRLKRTLKNA